MDRKILFLTEKQIFNEESTKKSKMCHKTPYRRKISREFRICYRNHISLRDREKSSKNIFLFSLTWEVFCSGRTRYEQTNIRNGIDTCNRTYKPKGRWFGACITSNKWLELTFNTKFENQDRVLLLLTLSWARYGSPPVTYKPAIENMNDCEVLAHILDKLDVICRESSVCVCFLDPMCPTFTPYLHTFRELKQQTSKKSLRVPAALAACTIFHFVGWCAKTLRSRS